MASLINGSLKMSLKKLSLKINAQLLRKHKNYLSIFKTNGYYFLQILILKLNTEYLKYVKLSLNSIISVIKLMQKHGKVRK